MESQEYFVKDHGTTDLSAAPGNPHSPMVRQFRLTKSMAIVMKLNELNSEFNLTDDEATELVSLFAVK